MLNILVCVKQVPDVNLVKIDPVTGSLIRKGVPAILNPLDENALEAAVRMKEQYGGTVTCITMGPPPAAEALRQCLAGGADRAILLSDRAFANADTLATSYVIVTAAKMFGNFDLIFCGKESMDGATGQMASQLAERLDASQLSCVSLINHLDTDKNIIQVQRELGNGTETAEAQLPCLITVEKTNYLPRIPNLERWLNSRTAEITTLSAAEIPGLKAELIGDPGSPTKVPRTYPPQTGEAGIILNEGNTEKNVAKLVSLLGEVL